MLQGRAILPMEDDMSKEFVVMAALVMGMAYGLSTVVTGAVTGLSDRMFSTSAQDFSAKFLKADGSVIER